MPGRPAIDVRPQRRLPAAALRRFLAARRNFTAVKHLVDGARMCARRPTAPGDHPGPAVVFIAGLGLSGRYLLPVAHELSARLPVWVPDLPGFGRSQRPSTTLDMAGLGDAVVAWMTAAGLDSAALVGNSMGCQVAVEAAARHPQRVSHLILEGPTMDSAARTVRQHAARVAVDAFREPLSLGPLQVFDWIGTGPRRLVATTRHAFAHRIEDRVRTVECPSLVVRGGRDPIVPQRWADEVTANLPRGTLRVVPGGTHAMTYSNPVVLADLVEQFVTEGRA